VANGADLSLIEVEVVDANGNRCPTALNLISFNMTGPAEWRGGIAQGPDNYILSRELPVECGVNRFLVRSTMMPGRSVLPPLPMGCNLLPCSSNRNHSPCRMGFQGDA